MRNQDGREVTTLRVVSRQEKRQKAEHPQLKKEKVNDESRTMLVSNQTNNKKK